ncbi:phospholipase B1, membrane-associated-like [Bacillus rossius redtenbacheri]|uniref:phospholipase B1, membrane-associated-like n=1 Tax=Bacillus rossius redtenbacheri TaxID=93214 RepID=UPI002FDCE51D
MVAALAALLAVAALAGDAGAVLLSPTRLAHAFRHLLAQLPRGLALPDLLRSKLGVLEGLRNLVVDAHLQKFQEPVGGDRAFPCPTAGGRSPERPPSVHRLRPGDIDVVGAIGDSLTAGTAVAARSPWEWFVDNRGMTAAIGGQSTWRRFLTLPNILKEFNPRLVGYSTRDSWSLAEDSAEQSQLNVAERGAESRDMLRQARELVRRMSSDRRVDLAADWKLVTIFMGSNDFCYEICNFKASEVLKNHRADLEMTLDYLRDNLPRSFVAVIPSPDLSSFVGVKGKALQCELRNQIACPCLLGKNFLSRKKEFAQTMKQFRQVQYQVVNSSRYEGKEDFAVVLQPFMEQLALPERDGMTDFSYLAIDCFHLSQKAQARAANAYWNNLLQPVGTKSRTWDRLFKSFLCPTGQHPYIYTRRNSGS